MKKILQQHPYDYIRTEKFKNIIKKRKKKSYLNLIASKDDTTRFNSFIDGIFPSA
jgi:hypothetical protein